MTKIILFQDSGVKQHQQQRSALVTTTTALALRDPSTAAAAASAAAAAACPVQPAHTAGIHSAGGGRRPVKVWNAARTVRKALVVATYEEFQRKGREKIGLNPSEPVRVVLEGDGTQVHRGTYLATLLFRLHTNERGCRYI